MTYASVTTTVNSQPVASLLAAGVANTSTIYLYANGSYDLEDNVTQLQFRWSYTVTSPGSPVPDLSAFQAVTRASHELAVRPTDQPGVFVAWTSQVGTTRGKDMLPLDTREPILTSDRRPLVLACDCLP